MNIGVALFQYGWAGVDLFFVLSGFLITTILLKTKDSEAYFRSFYGRRALRIFPLYFLALAVYFYVEMPWLVSRFGLPRAAWRDQLWCFAYAVNWHDILIGRIGGLEHLWSLSIEEQFYAFWAAAIWFCRRDQVARFCAAIIALALSARLICELRGADGEFLHRSTITRLDTLAFGALVAAVMQNDNGMKWLRRNFKVIATGACSVLAVIFSTDHLGRLPLPLTFYYLAFAVFFSCVVFHCVSNQGTNCLTGKFLRTAPLRSFGKFSYSIYLFHPAVHRYVPRSLAYCLSRAGLGGRTAAWATVAICIGLSYAMGAGTWYAFERHFLRLKRFFPYNAPTAESFCRARSRTLADAPFPPCRDRA